MRVWLGKFACSAIDAGLGGDTASAIRVAVLHYFRRLRSPRPPVAIPDFCRAPSTAPQTDFDIEIDPEVEAALTKEALRQGATIEQLVAHAVFVYLADLDRPIDRPISAALR
jgi:hypothetical protein